VNTAKANIALERLAKQKGVSVNMIRYEIERAIESALKNPDQKTRAFWLSVPRKGESPAPEEVIAYIAEIAKNGVRS
jgi:hypothetical protein